MPRNASRLVALVGLVVLVGCLHPKSQDCAGGWVCPAELACAAAPTYCANPQEVGACDGKAEHDPCRTAEVPDGQCIAGACQLCSEDLAGCRYIGWNPMMTAPEGDLDAVWFSGPADAYAGGTTGLYHYDGASWQPDATFPTLGMGDAVASLSGVDDADLFVVMKSNHVVYHHAAGAWVSAMTGGLGTKAVWAAGASDAFAVGFTGDIERFDGTAWAAVTGTTSTANLAAVWGSSATDVYAVGGTDVTHFDGSTWTTQAVAVAGLDAVWGSGPNDVYAGGPNAIFHSANGGGSWTKITVAATITALWGSSPTDVYAGTSTGPILHSDDGVTWAPMIAPVPQIAGIAGSSAAEVFAVADTNGILRYTGASWTDVTPSPATSDLAAAWVSSPSAVYVVGSEGVIEHYDGAAWKPHDIASSIDLTGVWARGATDAYAVGGANIEHWDGSAWSSETDPDNIDLMAVTGTSTAEFAAGTHLATADTTGAWTDVTMFDSALPSLWVAPDDGSIFLAGDQLYVYRGGALAVLLAEGGWNAIWGTSSSDVYAAGDGGKIRHYDGTSWSTPQDTGTVVDLRALWGTGDDDVFAAGDAGTLLHYHAQLWTVIPPRAGVTTSFASVAGAGSTIFVVGASGTAERLIESAP